MNISKKIINEISEFHENESPKILRALYNSKLSEKYTPMEIASVIVNTTMENELEDSEEFFKETNELISTLLDNDELRESFDRVNSSYKFGLILITLGLSYVNTDNFAFEAIKSMNEDELSYEDIDFLKEANISMLPKKIKRMIDEIYEDRHNTDTENSPDIGLQALIEAYKNNKCNFGDLLEYIKENELDLEDVIKVLQERILKQ